MAIKITGKNPKHLNLPSHMQKGVSEMLDLLKAGTTPEELEDTYSSVFVESDKRTIGLGTDEKGGIIQLTKIPSKAINSIHWRLEVV